MPVGDAGRNVLPVVRVVANVSVSVRVNIYPADKNIIGVNIEQSSAGNIDRNRLHVNPASALIIDAVFAETGRRNAADRRAGHRSLDPDDPRHNVGGNTVVQHERNHRPSQGERQNRAYSE